MMTTQAIPTARPTILMNEKPLCLRMVRRVTFIANITSASSRVSLVLIFILLPYVLEIYLPYSEVQKICQDHLLGDSSCTRHFMSTLEQFLSVSEQKKIFPELTLLNNN